MPIRCEDLLNEVVNFERVRQQKVVKLFLSATNVRTGKVAVFRTRGDHRRARAGFGVPAVHDARAR